MGGWSLKAGPPAQMGAAWKGCPSPTEPQGSGVNEPVLYFLRHRCDISTGGCEAFPWSSGLPDPQYGWKLAGQCFGTAATPGQSVETHPGPEGPRTGEKPWGV